MKTLYESIFDVEDNIEKVENTVERAFNDFKETIFDKRRYKGLASRNFAPLKDFERYPKGWKILFSIIGFSDVIHITLDRTKSFSYNKYTDEKLPYWEWIMYIRKKDNKIYTLRVVSEAGKRMSEEKFMDNYVGPYFKDIETFAKFVKDQLKFI